MIEARETLALVDASVWLILALCALAALPLCTFAAWSMWSTRRRLSIGAALIALMCCPIIIGAPFACEAHDILAGRVYPC